MPRSGRRHLGALMGATIGVAAVVAACGSSSTTGTGSPATAEAGATTSTAGSSYSIVPAAQVTAGLAEVRKLGAEAKAKLATDQPGAKTTVKTMYDKWFEFEGTVRKNDKNLYLQMEDGLAAIKAGVEQNNTTKVDKGINDLETGANQYLVKNP